MFLHEEGYTAFYDNMSATELTEKLIRTILFAALPLTGFYPEHFVAEMKKREIREGNTAKKEGVFDTFTRRRARERERELERSKQEKDKVEKDKDIV